MVSEIIKLHEIETLAERLLLAASLTEGPIVEIGGGEGIHTAMFARTMRQVIVIDPFEQIEGVDESYFKPYPLDKFLSNTLGFDNISIILLPSQHPSIKETKLIKGAGFVFIDGQQDEKSVMSDLALANDSGAKIICLDDYDRLSSQSQVPTAVHKYLKNNTEYKYFYPGKREIYLYKI